MMKNLDIKLEQNDKLTKHLLFSFFYLTYRYMHVIFTKIVIGLYHCG